MSQRQFILQYENSDLDKCSITSKDLVSFLKRADLFLGNGCEFRAIFNAKDVETKAKLFELFDRHMSKYTIDDNSKSLLLETAKGAGSGVLETVSASGTAVAGIAILETASKSLGDLAGKIGHHVIDQAVGHAFDAAASSLHHAADFLHNFAHIVTDYVVPVGGFVRIAWKAYSYYRDAKEKNEDAIIIVSFVREKLSKKDDDIKEKMLPTIRPIAEPILQLVAG